MVKHVKPATLLIGILIIGFILRLYGFTNPIADWHSWRQADTSAVSRNFVDHGFDLLHPRFDDLSNVPSGKDNPKGYRFVEFPIYNVFQAGLTKIFGILTLEEWGRIVTIIASLSISFFLYKLVTAYSGRTAGIAAAAFYTFLPYNIYYGRTILPDTMMVAAIIGGIYLFDLWIKTSKWKWYGLSLLLTIAALLLKPYALFYVPVFLALLFSTFQFGLLKQWKVWLYAILAVIPLALWRYWMGQFPEGIPANAWLMNGNGIRFRPAFFRWLGYERLTKLIAGYAGMIFFLLGIVQLRVEKAKLLYGSFILSIAAYLVIFATGNVQHDYYQIVTMPVVAILFALGVKFLLQIKQLPKNVAIGLVVIIALLSFYLSWTQVKDYFNINNQAIVIAGQAVDRLTPKDAKVIAIYTGDTSFLYQTHRKGWASFQDPLPIMIEKGADYLVFAAPTQAERVFEKEYKILAETKDYLIFDLHQRP